jgi:hypothetical protein
VRDVGNRLDREHARRLLLRSEPVKHSIRGDRGADQRE